MSERPTPGGSEEQSAEESEVYRRLQAVELETGAEQAASNSERVPLERADYVAQATDVFNTLAPRSREPFSWAEAQATARREYVDQEPNPQLRALADAILEAPKMPILQRELASLSQKRHELKREGGELAADELNRFRELTNESAEYSHNVRDMVIASGDEIDREELEGWLGRGSGNRAWVEHRFMPGVAAEVALYHFFDELEGVEVHPGTVEQDVRQGRDLEVIFKDGRKIGIDAKHGSATMALRRGGVMEFGVPPEVIDGFRIHDEATEALDEAFFDELEGSESREAWSSDRAA